MKEDSALNDRQRGNREAAATSSYVLGARRFKIGEVIFWAATLGVYFVFPYNLAFACNVAIVAIFVLSLDLILGFAGLVSLGHALFFGIGAYAAGQAALNGWSEPISGALFGGLCAAVIAPLIGVFILRLAEMPLIMVTLALNVIAYEAANKATLITNGDDGLFGIEPSPIFGFFKWSLYSETAYLYALAALFIFFCFAKRLVASPFGMALRGLRENRRRMALIGTPVIGYLVRIYTISAFMAGVAGAMSAQTAKFVGLGVISLDTSIAALVMLVLGGPGRIYGALIGTIVYEVVEHIASEWNPYNWMFIIGALLVLIVMYAQGGLLGVRDKIVGLWQPAGKAPE
jgi:branched-chain amino acid transport system permease protein